MGVGSGPGFDGGWIGVTGVISELFNSAFDLLEDTFDVGPVPVRDVANSGDVPVEWDTRPRCVTDENVSVVDVVGPFEFGETDSKQRRVVRRKRPDVEQSE